MIKSYLLMGSLMLSGIAMVGGSSYYNGSDYNREQLRFTELAAGETALSGDNYNPVPLPLWILQKIFSSEVVSGTPVPCPVWLLYNLNTSDTAPKTKT